MPSIVKLLLKLNEDCSRSESCRYGSSAIMAWANIDKAKVYQFFYTADYVDHHNHEWDARHEERKTDAMTFFEIAVSIALELEK